jgi:hypothetical protein
MKMSEWKDFWQNVGIAVSIIIGVIGASKVIVELRRFREQREKEVADHIAGHKLKRTEFFLDQHRRLFDNDDLYEVLCFLDGDLPQLADPAMWDKKRKFLTFIEEIALLVKSGYINPRAAYYMFGYYAQCAHEGRHFRVGIAMTAEHWALFFRFVENSKRFDRNPRRRNYEIVDL